MTSRLDTVPMVHYELGQAEALLRAARSLLFETVRETWESLSATNVLTMDQRAALRTATTFALRQSATVVDTAYNLAGASAVLTSHPIQRQFQDIHVITQHVQSRQAHYELIGRYLLGQPADSRYL
jgi:alkylation response protein AidB-like acyl-CoA dehydrogenase